MSEKKNCERDARFSAHGNIWDESWRGLPIQESEGILRVVLCQGNLVKRKGNEPFSSSADSVSWFTFNLTFLQTQPL